VERVHVVPARDGIRFDSTLVVLPAVILHVPQRYNPLAINAVERIEPGVVVEVRNVPVMGRLIDDLTIVLDGLECRPEPRARDIVRGDQVDCSLVVTEGTGRGIRNVDLLT